jgi:hypothetical protein
VVVDEELLADAAQGSQNVPAPAPSRPRVSAPNMNEDENTPKPTAPRLRFDSPFKPKR